MTRFRPCIDLHHGKVKQIVGGSLTDDGAGLRTNFESEHPASYYAAMYQRDGLTGGHVICLGPGNAAAATSALATYPGGLQIGGGVSVDTAPRWIDAGASHVIVTSWVFNNEGLFLPERLQALVDSIGKSRLVLDLSCRRTARGWTVAMNRWQTLTDIEITPETLQRLAGSCDEFLIHAADVEGKMAGMDEELISLLGQWGGLPMTYAGGAASLQDLERCHTLSGGRVDLTIGSALDVFGGRGVRYADCVTWNHRDPAAPQATL